MNFFLIHCIEALIYPPGGPILLLLTGLPLLKRWPFLASVLISSALFILYFSSIPLMNRILAHRLESDRPPDVSVLKTAGALVVLGCEPYYGATEYDGAALTSGRDEMSRLRYAAYLYRKSGLPIAVIGGDRLKTGKTGAERMREVLEREFNVPVPYQDGRSMHTFDNAEYAHEILSKEEINRIVLVTHAWHMRRAKRSFVKAGFSVIAAPTGFFVPGPLEKGIGQWIPTSEALERNRRFFHEIAGLLWFRLFEQQGGVSTGSEKAN